MLLKNFGVSSKKTVVYYQSFRNMKYLRITLLKHVFENLPFLNNICLDNNNRLLSSSEKTVQQSGVSMVPLKAR